MIFQHDCLHESTKFKANEQGFFVTGDRSLTADNESGDVEKITGWTQQQIPSLLDLQNHDLLTNPDMEINSQIGYDWGFAPNAHPPANIEIPASGWNACNVPRLRQLYPPCRYQPCKMLIAAVISAFGIVGKDAGRQLAHPGVVLDTFTADPFSRARFIRAVAAFQVLLFFAFHATPLPSNRFHQPPPACP
jgi:hypothetical protein